MAIITVIGLRHGKAAHSETTDLPGGTLRDHKADLARPLTEVGIQQAQERAKKLAGVKIDTIVCSPAERALQTAEIVSGVNRSEYNFHVLDKLYTPEGADGEAMDKMFEQLGYEPPSVYMEHELDSPKDRWGHGVLGRMSFNSGQELPKFLWKRSEITALAYQADETVLIAGHAVYVPMAVLGFVDAVVGANELVYKALLGVNMTEAGAFRVTFNMYDLTQTTFEAFE